MSILCLVAQHDWEYFDTEVDGICFSYRHCKSCGKWQEFGAGYGDTYWDDCQPPKGLRKQGRKR